ncbi:MAG: hypothetical protein JKY17_01610 [Magnetovibrio sp.]|nr:hypothetical protein [Magnetovibrio sp.]
MKKRDKYPGASEEQINAMGPGLKVLGLHPLIWVVIVVVSIAAARACDSVEKLGCNFFKWYDSEDHSSDHRRHSEDSDKNSDSKGLENNH